MLIVGVLAVFMPGLMTASADPSAEIEITTAMTVQGFDHAVAKANGYEIRTDVAGREYSVKQGQPVDVGPSSENGSVVNGTCGFSFVKINGIGGYTAKLETGAGVYAPVVAYEWHVKIFDNRGVSSQDWGPVPGPGTPGLGLTRNLPGLAGGTVLAELQGSSRTVLNTGAICYAATHADSGWVY